MARKTAIKTTTRTMGKLPVQTRYTYGSDKGVWSDEHLEIIIEDGELLVNAEDCETQYRFTAEQLKKLAALVDAEPKAKKK